MGGHFTLAQNEIAKFRELFKSYSSWPYHLFTQGLRAFPNHMKDTFKGWVSREEVEISTSARDQHTIDFQPGACTS